MGTFQFNMFYNESLQPLLEASTDRGYFYQSKVKQLNMHFKSI